MLLSGKKPQTRLWAENPHHKQRYENYKKENLDEEAKASTERFFPESADNAIDESKIK